jgi:hypothetical protein
MVAPQNPGDSTAQSQSTTDGLKHTRLLGVRELQYDT